MRMVLGLLGRDTSSGMETILMWDLQKAGPREREIMSLPILFDTLDQPTPEARRVPGISVTRLLVF